MEQLELVFPYLRELGAIHQKHGVKRHHIDLGQSIVSTCLGHFLVVDMFGTFFSCGYVWDIFQLWTCLGHFLIVDMFEPSFLVVDIFGTFFSCGYVWDNF